MSLALWGVACGGSEPVVARGVYEIELVQAQGPAEDVLRVSGSRRGEIDVDPAKDTLTLWMPMRTNVEHTHDHRYEVTHWERRTLEIDGAGTNRVEQGCVVRDRAELVKHRSGDFTVLLHTDVLSACDAGAVASGTRTLRHRLMQTCDEGCGFTPEGDACTCPREG